MTRATIAVSSGKGGTGKTFVSTNIARVLERAGKRVRYLDCDVEEPNGHLFLHPESIKLTNIMVMSPGGADPDKCILCGKCVAACKYNALALVKDKLLFFRNLCRICGACMLVCPHDSITVKPRKIGELVAGKSGEIEIYYGLLETGEGGMTPRLIKKVKEHSGAGIAILDSPPGTSCPVVETVKDADLCVLVTDPTPFGINDLGLAVDMCRKLGKEPVIVVNRAEYRNSDLKNYCEREGLSIVGEIPDERKVAECYSSGGLAVDAFPEYHDLFVAIALRLLDEAMKRKTSQIAAAASRRKIERPAADSATRSEPQKIEHAVRRESTTRGGTKEVVVISGKGGTGKTSLVAAFCALEKNIAISDCDVDAADLHLVLAPSKSDGGLFSGSEIALIDPEKCTSCGMCHKACRFDAVRKIETRSGIVYRIDELSCEGCGVCGLECEVRAISFGNAISGEWFSSRTRFGPMSHAKLGIAEANSGKLVTLIRNKKDEAAAALHLSESVVDGSPGTGCPVIASITGTDYAVIVTEPTVSGVHDLQRILDVVRFFGLRSGIVVNKCDINPVKTKEIKDIARLSGSDFLGEIPYDKSMTEAQMNGVSVIEYPGSPLVASIERIWEKARDKAFSINVGEDEKANARI